jgi:ankyrin repeat protein
VPSGALLTLVLALALPVEKAKEMAKTLLGLGTTSAQADMNGVTAFHRYVDSNAESLLELLWKTDPAGSKTAVEHIAFRHSSCETPLQAAVQNGNLPMVLQLLDHGAVPQIEFEAWYVLPDYQVLLSSRVSSTSRVEDCRSQNFFNLMFRSPEVSRYTLTW